MFAFATDDDCYLFGTTITQRGEGRPGRVGTSDPLPPHYFFGTTIALTVAVTSPTTSTTTM
jgi:hypothetical protein